MAKKRHFNCTKCGSTCEIYRKGKKHRLLVCPTCGIVASNPIPLLAPLVAGGAAYIGGKIAEKVTGGDKQPTSTPASIAPSCAAPVRSRTSGTWYIDKALKA